jgi:enhancing lycopene biosynthesis protein 2
MPSLPIAVILAGCGRADGSEITEAVSCLIHLDRVGLKYKCFAPDAPQAEVVNHATGQPAPGEHRNMLVEAARISRGDITPLDKLDVASFAAAIFPGGFGAAKNLCTFASKGAACDVRPDVASAIKSFHAAGKPLGFVCIAPVIAAKVLGTAAGGPGCSLTIGSDKATADALAAMGATNIERAVTQAHADKAHKIVSTPAYMCDAGPHAVFTGIGAMVDELKAML